MYIYKHQNANASVISVTSAAATIFQLINTAAGTEGPNAGFQGQMNALNLRVENGDIRYLMDGNTPTALKGMLAPKGTVLCLRGVSLDKLQLISTSGSNVSCSVEVGTSESGETSMILPPGSLVGDDPNLNLKNVNITNPDPLQYVDPVPVISASQDLTASFVDLGPEISCKGLKYLSFYLVIDINDSQDVRFRFLAKHAIGGTNEYKIDHNSVEAPDAAVSSTDDYIEFSTDADQLVLVRIPLNNSIHAIQPQVSAGTVGASAGQIDEANCQLGY